MTMRSRWTAALSAIAMLALAPSFASANDEAVQQQLQQMQNRMQQMEDKLQATTDQLESANERVDEQSQLIEQSGLAETRGASNGLPGFLGQITVGGWVAGSYFWNINHPTSETNLGYPTGDGMGGTNQGLNGAFYPLHPDHNSFALDQVWFEVERPIDEENRAGFRLDTVYGKTGALLNGGGPNNRFTNLDDSSIYLHQGYVQYLAPIGDGVTFKAGKFATPFGYEVAGTIYNQNITRGNVWTLLEPIDHIGVSAGYTFGDTGFDVMGGVVNGYTPNDPDNNESKSVIGHIGWANETLSVGVNGIYGNENTASSENALTVINGVVQFNPTDRLALFVNGDYADAANNGIGKAWGVATGGRFAVTDRTGVSIRGEYVADNNNFLGFCSLPNSDFVFGSADGCTSSFDEDFVATDVKIFGITATVDHLLTDQLMVRGEIRWDNIRHSDNTGNGEFFNGSLDDSESDLGLKSNQVVLGAEVVYNFNKFGGE
jgi:hypothetical protein